MIYLNNFFSHKKSFVVASTFLVLSLSLASCSPKKSHNKGQQIGQVLLCDKNNNQIEIFSDVNVNPKLMFTPDFSNSVTTLKSGTKATIIESFEKGFEGEPIAEKVEVSENKSGWVAEQQVCIPASIKQQEEDGKNYLRNGETFSHKIVKELKKDDVFYIQKSTYSTIQNFKGCENDWYFTVLTSGESGYMHCSMVKAIIE